MIKISFSHIDGLNNKAIDWGFEELLKCASQYQETYTDYSIGSIPGVNIARRIFHQIGIDPTRYRPSSEALLKRALKSKDFFKINTVVDICNWCSLDFLLPICAYNADRITGDIELRLGRANERYIAHNNREINQEGKFLLADNAGPFGAPITDSRRTGVDEETSRILLAIFCSSALTDEELLAKAEILNDRIIKGCGGKKGTIEIRYWENQNKQILDKT